ncbi:transmembrane protein 116 [Conger conger]|uniref:transmembrane protein 116 n=1 Tax=Conger conger TaxID=82655 RepID=UPI002A5A5B12|nr:transmembrane protein 116 [Conger conger]XP_061117350.1 transmembrane protein 116 [Conger conger]
MLSLFLNNTEENITTAEDWTSVYIDVRWIQLIMAVLSILGSGSIIVYAAFQNLIRTPEVLPLFLLSVMDLLLSLSWLIGAVLFTQVCEKHPTCYNLHTIQQIFYLSSFFYTLNYILVLYRGLKEKYHGSLNGYNTQFSRSASSFGSIFAVLSFLVPVILMVPVFTVGNFEDCYTNFSRPYKCLLMHTGPLYSSPWYRKGSSSACYAVQVYSTAIFLSAFLLTFLGIVVLMGRARGLYKRCATSSGVLGGRQWAVLRVLERRMVLYPSAFFFCWGPAIILATIILFAPNTVQGWVGYILYILQALTSGSQGLLNCLVYGWTQQDFRTLSSKAVRHIDTQTPLLRSQKKGYNTLSSMDLCT